MAKSEKTDRERLEQKNLPPFTLWEAMSAGYVERVQTPINESEMLVSYFGNVLDGAKRVIKETETDVYVMEKPGIDALWLWASTEAEHAVGGDGVDETMEAGIVGNYLLLAPDLLKVNGTGLPEEKDTLQRVVIEYYRTDANGKDKTHIRYIEHEDITKWREEFAKKEWRRSRERVTGKDSFATVMKEKIEWNTVANKDQIQNMFQRLRGSLDIMH